MADLLKQSTAANIAVMMFASDGVTRQTGVTTAHLVVKAIKNDASEVTVTLTSWTEVDSVNAPGVYMAGLPAGILNELGVLVLSFNSTSSPVTDFTIMRFQIVGYLNDDVAVLLFRSLGLLHENSVLDITSFDGNNNLTSGRLRIYSTAADAAAAQAASPGTYDTNKIGQYSIAATYTGVNLATYLVQRNFP
jgi:hypothetical protein